MENINNNNINNNPEDGFPKKEKKAAFISRESIRAIHDVKNSINMKRMDVMSVLSKLNKSYSTEKNMKILVNAISDKIPPSKHIQHTLDNTLVVIYQLCKDGVFNNEFTEAIINHYGFGTMNNFSSYIDTINKSEGSDLSNFEEMDLREQIKVNVEYGKYFKKNIENIDAKILSKGIENLRYLLRAVFEAGEDGKRFVKEVEGSASVKTPERIVYQAFLQSPETVKYFEEVNNYNDLDGYLGSSA